MNLKQKVLMTLGTVGVAAAVAGGGSFASFNAQTTNPNTFATGTLVMSNKVNVATACLFGIVRRTFLARNSGMMRSAML